MKYLLDASSLMLLIKKADVESTVACLKDSLILDLTFYEIGNAVWKESTLLKFLTPEKVSCDMPCVYFSFWSINSIISDKYILGLAFQIVPFHTDTASSKTWSLMCLFKNSFETTSTFI